MWIDYKRAYAMIPDSWVLGRLGLMKLAENTKSLLKIFTEESESYAVIR